METIYTPVRFKERTLRILFLVMQVIIMKIYYASKRVEPFAVSWKFINFATMTILWTEG